MREHKIGEIFEYNGEWFQCVECDSCGKCPLRTTECRSCTKSDLADEVFGECSKIRRSDYKYIIFKKLEKIGEPYEKRVSDGTFSKFQRYKVYNSVVLPKEPYIYCNFIDGTVEIEIKQIKEDMEEKKLNLKPFDIQKAREGKPVCTRDGRKARIICFDRIFYHEGYDYPIVAMVNNKGDESVHAYTKDGLLIGDKECDYDLMMLFEKKEGWVNVYYNRTDGITFSKHPYPSKEEAIKNVGTMSNRIDTVRISWEE